MGHAHQHAQQHAQQQPGRFSVRGLLSYLASFLPTGPLGTSSFTFPPFANVLVRSPRGDLYSLPISFPLAYEHLAAD